MRSNDTPRVLIADDQPDVLIALKLLLKGEGYQIEQAASPQQILNALETREYDLVLMDLNYTRDTTSGQEGLDLLNKIATIDPAIPIVVMTAWGSVELAVEAVRRGARDFIPKPWENARLLTIVKTQVDLGAALRKGMRLEAENKLLRLEGGPLMIAGAAAMQPVLQMISRIGPSDANVLITGEPGTGKEVVARTLYAQSSRGPKPMVTVNAGGLAEGVFESELFGHVRGAYTDAKADRVGRFELADGGTLFLDEIANVPMPLQAKLLRVLETGEMEKVGSSRTVKVDVRIISATNADLHVEVANQRFREDLLFRLNTIEIHLPPLRERPEDIPLLAAQCLEEQAQRYRKNVERFDPSAIQALERCLWPGNIRELEHSVERGVLMCSGPEIKAADLGLRAAREPEPRVEDLALEDVERLVIRKALARFDGSAIKAAEALGLSRSAFYRRLEKYGL